MTGVADPAAGELRVADLAAATGVTVRNIRAYQDRGLLPPPRKEGRIVWYSQVHVERLEIITSLLERGFSTANIAELLEGWRGGGSIADVVGLGRRITGSFVDEVADEGSPLEIAERFGLHADEAPMLASIVEAGLIEFHGERWRVPSPRLLRAGVQLKEAGVPIEELLDELARVRASVREIADDMVALIKRNVWAPHFQGQLPSLPTLVEVAEIVDRIRPLAQTVVTVELARALQASTDAAVQQTLAELAEPP